MELFLQNGHLSDEGLEALAQGSLDELGRLEAAEHLSFCDDCLVRYTALLTDDVLQQPQQDVTLPVMRKLRQRTMKVLVNRYTAAVAAVMIAGTLWYSGVLTSAADAFASRTPDLATPPAVTQTQAPEAPKNTIAATLNGWLDSVGSVLRPQKSPQPAATAAPQATPAPTAAPQATPEPQATKAPQPEATPNAPPQSKQDGPRDYSISNFLKSLFNK